MSSPPSRKKLIEVALPLEAINAASAREKSIRHGHPSTLHLWWARRPLAACRAVLFASLVDDPSSRPEEFPTKEAQDRERRRLFDLIERLVPWEASTDEAVLEEARKEIRRSTGGNPPPVLDPFCGGGSIPLEAQRLGLEAHASDLNPVAVLITKALIEIPPKFAGMPPVNPAMRKKKDLRNWKGAEGLAEDVRYYGQWMRDEAEKHIGHLYPKVKLPKEHGGGEATVIAWLWARTVKCPNPACGATMPLAASFNLSTKKGKEAWVEYEVDRSCSPPVIRFSVNSGSGSPPDPPKIGRGAKFRCLACDQPCDDQHIKNEAMAGRMGAQLMAVVAEGNRSRTYLPPTKDQIKIAENVKPVEGPQADLPDNPRWFSPPMYGLKHYSDLFTPRQLVALTTFSDLVAEAREKALADAKKAGLADDGIPLIEGGRGAEVYADSVSTYLSFAVDKMTTTNCSICTWQTSPTRLVAAFSRQAIPMVWDYAEANPFSGAAGDYSLAIKAVNEVTERLLPRSIGHVQQLDATAQNLIEPTELVCTDPPYYDNIGYADLSDYFYVWIRRSLSRVYPDLFSTMLVPKAQELVATPYRFDGDKGKAERFFEEGLGKAFVNIRKAQDPKYPFTVFYAFKQAESEAVDGNGNAAVSSTGWETMLDGLITAGFSITATWPVRTELIVALKKRVSSLASSIVLACRPRPEDAPMATRREFLAALKKELPEALKTLQKASIAPVDLAQAAIGPGMAAFSRFSKVVEADGSAMPVRTALALINQELDAFLAEQEGEMDGDSRFCLAWFEQYGMKEGPFGEGDVLARAKNTSVEGIARAECLVSKGGKIRLLKRSELPGGYDPVLDARRTVWECAQHLIKRLDEQGLEAAGRLAHRMGGDYADRAKALAYRLFAVCERKGWADEALAYNRLITSWADIVERAVPEGGGEYRLPGLGEE